MENYLKIAKIFEEMVKGTDESLNYIRNLAVNDKCPIVRHEAVFALGEMAAKDSVKLLKEIVLKDKDLVVRHEALVAIGTLGDFTDIAFLEGFLRDPVYEISKSASIAIERIRQEPGEVEDIWNNLEEYKDKLFFSDTPTDLKIQILFQLMRKGDANSVEVIRKCFLEDSCPIVRHEAGFVLGEIGTLRSVEVMKEALEYEKNEVVIHETLLALGTSGKKEALEVVERFLDSEVYLVAESARIAKDRLLNLKDPYSGARHFT